MDNIFESSLRRVLHKFNIHSPKTDMMCILMEQSDGSTNLREDHARLFNQAPSWEQMAMAAIVWNKGAQILGKVKTASDARTAWYRIVNLFDGVATVLRIK